MSLFGKKPICSICNELESNKKILDGNVCLSCLKKTFGYLPLKHPKDITISEVNRAILQKRENDDRKSQFVASKKISTFFQFDEIHQWWLVPDGFMGATKNPKIYKCEDIMEYELIEDGETIVKGGLGSAVAGGVLFGGVGAVVGGLTGGKKSKSTATKLQIKITINDINNPIVYINFIATETKKKSLVYKAAYASAQEILSVLSIIKSVDTENSVTESINNTSVADEILKFNNLLKEGIISQEEFEVKKKQLLGL